MSSLERAQQSVVKPVPVPQALAELGVRVGVDEPSGLRVVVIPPNVRQSLNVIDPVSSFAQADPNWTPRISVVALDPSKDGDHFYEQAGRKLAPTKQALEILAKAAGILYTRTSRIPRDQLAEGERLGYKATLGIRRNDGTVEEVTRDKTFVEDAELEEIKDAVARTVTWESGRPTNKPKFSSDEERTEETRKRWLRELKDAPAKTESKAVLRAIRAALQIPHTFSPADAAKPFLVIGFNFSPDYSDEETKRLLIAAGLNAQAAFYGPSSVSTRGDLELEASTTPPAPQPTDAAAAEHSADAAPDGAGHSDDEGQQAAGASTPSPRAPAAPDPDEEARAIADSAGREGVPDKVRAFAGMTIAQVHADGGDAGLDFLRSALSPGRAWNKADDRDALFGDALRTYVAYYLPELLGAREEAA